MESKKFRNKTTGEIVTSFNITEIKNFEEVNMEKRKELFKSVYGELIDKKFVDLSDKEIIEIALDTVKQFGQRQRIDVNYSISLDF